MSEREHVIDDECLDCEEGMEDKCPESKRSCGHHCNHAWTHDKCCWCGEEFGGDEVDAS